MSVQYFSTLVISLTLFLCTENNEDVEFLKVSPKVPQPMILGRYV